LTAKPFRVMVWRRVKITIAERDFRGKGGAKNGRFAAISDLLLLHKRAKGGSQNMASGAKNENSTEGEKTLCRDVEDAREATFPSHRGTGCLRRGWTFFCLILTHYY